ncbi:MAG TPA: hypothetical protein PK765_05540 [bacterium]|nr:hypothetical protein [bacterium]
MSPKKIAFFAIIGGLVLLIAVAGFAMSGAKKTDNAETQSN